MLALAAVLLSYGLAQLIGGYGFVAVFVTALAIRAQEPGHPFHRTLHEFVGQLERLLTMALLLALGLALPTLLTGSLTWPVAAVAVGAVLVVRPLAAGLAMVGSGVADADRRSIAFFGVRGIGSFYYLAFGLAGLRADPAADTLWAVVSMTVVVSVVVHGASGSVVLRRLDRQAGRPTPEPA